MVNNQPMIMVNDGDDNGDSNQPMRISSLQIKGKTAWFMMKHGPMGIHQHFYRGYSHVDGWDRFTKHFIVGIFHG